MLIVDALFQSFLWCWSLPTNFTRKKSEMAKMLQAGICLHVTSSYLLHLISVPPHVPTQRCVHMDCHWLLGK